MNLADLLSYADIHHLTSIAGNYECNCNGHSKNELIQSILVELNKRDTFERNIERLSIEDVRFLNTLIFEERELFSVEELLARIGQSAFDLDRRDRPNPKDTLADFKRRGWLFNGYSHETKFMLQFPKDLKRRLGDAFAAHFNQKLQFATIPDVYRDEQQLIVDDIFKFLQFVDRQDIVLAVDGAMYKRTLQQLLGILTVQEEPIGKTGGWRFGYGRRFKDYPNRFSLVYDYCFYHELIDEQDGRLTLTTKAKQMASDRTKEDLAKVYRFWIRLYRGPIPNLSALVNWISRLSSKRWVSINSLSEALCNLIKPFYYDSSQSILHVRIIQMMMHLGLLKLGEAEQFGQVVQMTSLGASVISGTYVHANEKINME